MIRSMSIVQYEIFMFEYGSKNRANLEGKVGYAGLPSLAEALFAVWGGEGTDFLFSVLPF